MSINRYIRADLFNFYKWANRYLVVENNYFGYVDRYGTGGEDGIHFYRDAPVYTLLTSDIAPDGWSTNYNDYYTKSGNDYIKNDFAEAPEWEANVYYSRTAPTQKALTIGRDPRTSSATHYPCVIAYKSDAANGYEIIDGTVSNSTTLPDSYLMYVADGGVLMRISYSGSSTTRYIVEILLAKTNKGETAIVFNGHFNNDTITVSDFYTNVHVVAYGDCNETSKLLSFTPQEQFQTKLSPFTTFANEGETSYTPTAYYCPISSVYSLRNNTVMYDETYYLTNGYWMIKDEEPIVPESNT